MNCQTAATACATFARALPLVERGGTVHLASGSYQPDQVVIQKLVTVAGARRGATILYATPGRRSIFEVRSWLLLSGVTLSGERLTGDGAFWGIHQQDGSLVSVIDCAIQDYTGINSVGISNDGGMLVVENTQFTNNYTAIENANLHGSRTHISASQFNGNTEGFHNGWTGYAIIDDDTEFRDNYRGAGNQGILRISDTNFSGSRHTGIANVGSIDSLLVLTRVYINGSVEWGVRNDVGHLTINASDLAGNPGTAISITRGSLEVIRSLIHENGNGILIGNFPAEGRKNISVRVTQTAIVRNQKYGIASSVVTGPIYLQNVTVSSNNLSWTVGHGISLLDGGNLTVEDSSIVHNQGAGIIVSGGTSTVDIRRSVVADNTGGQCEGSALPFAIDNPVYACAEELTLGMLHIGDLTYEGDTIVHPLLDGSPLIDTAAPGCPGVDQRNAARPVGGGCDIGAYEYQLALTAGEGTQGIIPLPTETPESQPNPDLTFTTDTNCRRGPGTNYTVLTNVSRGTTVSAEGRNEYSSWWYIQPSDTQPACWVADSTVDKLGSPEGVPVMVGPVLPDPPEGFDAVPVCDTKAKTYIVKLNWIGQAGATGYRLYRNGQVLAQVNANTTSYKDSPSVGGQGFSYGIESIGTDGVSILIGLSVPACG